MVLYLLNFEEIPLLIAHFSDVHIGTGSDFLGGRMNTELALRKAVACVAALSPQPDVVLITGDLAENGLASEYAVLGNALSELSLPVFAVPGNHDDSSVACAVLARYMPVAGDAPSGSCCYSVVRGDLMFIGLDTTVPGRAFGALDASRLDWLASTLHLRKGYPVLLFMHHPPLPTGLEAMDACRLIEGADRLAAIIREHGAVQGVLCGHLHRPVHMQFAGVPLSTAPSVAHQIDLDLRPAASLRARLEPPKMLLHRWTPSFGLCTHVCYLEPFGAALAL